MTGKICTLARWPTTVLAATLLIGVCGCGKSATVAGKVSFQGRPVTYGSVIFLTVDNKARSGVIEPDGSYTVEGVPSGPARIGVISRDPSKGRSTLRGDKPVPPTKKGAAAQKKPDSAWFPLPHKLEDPASSGLTCTVGSGRVHHDIELK